MLLGRVEQAGDKLDRDEGLRHGSEGEGSLEQSVRAGGGGDGGQRGYELGGGESQRPAGWRRRGGVLYSCW